MNCTKGLLFNICKKGPKTYKMIAEENSLNKSYTKGSFFPFVFAEILVPYILAKCKWNVLNWFLKGGRKKLAILEIIWSSRILVGEAEKSILKPKMKMWFSVKEKICQFKS